MKKRTMRILTLLLCALLVVSLGGCTLPGVRVDDPGKTTTTPSEESETGETTQPSIPPNVEYTILENPRVYVTIDKVKFYDEPATGARVKNIMAKDSQVTVIRFAQTDEGRWAETEEGWVQMEWLTPLDEDPNEYPIPAVVKIDLIRIREEPTSSSELVGHIAKGEQIYILKIVETEDGKTWGQIENGWVFLDYVSLYDIAGKENYGQQNGTVVISGSPLNVREGPSSVFAVVGYLNNGDRVTISQETVINGVRWGKIKDGWICMDYVLLDKDKPKIPDAEPPGDRSIIGSWLYCPKPYGFAEDHNPASDGWEFYGDGTFSVVSSSGWTYDAVYGWTPDDTTAFGGIYTFDGKRLNMYYLDAEGELLRQEEYTLKRDNDNRVLDNGAILCPQGSDHATYALIKTLVNLNRTSLDTSICGSWVTLEADDARGGYIYSNWLFYTDGRYERYMVFYAPDGEGWKNPYVDRMREGTYLYCNGTLTIVNDYDGVASAGSERYESKDVTVMYLYAADEQSITTDSVVFYADTSFEDLYQRLFG